MHRLLSNYILGFYINFLKKLLLSLCMIDKTAHYDSKTICS